MVIDTDGVEVIEEPVLPKIQPPGHLLDSSRVARRFKPPERGLTARQDIEQQAKTAVKAVWDYVTRENRDDELDEIIDMGDEW